MDMSSLNQLPVWKRMNPIKKKVVIELLDRCEGKRLNESSGAIMAAIMKLREKSLSFTSEETDLLMGELTKNMPPGDIAKVEMIKQMMKNM